MKNPILTRTVAGILSCAALLSSASALEYRFDDAATYYDGKFYQTTSNNPSQTDALNNGNAPNKIIVTADGQVTYSGAGVASESHGASVNSPEINIGQYPDMWGSAIEATINNNDKLADAAASGYEAYDFGNITDKSALTQNSDGSYGAVSLGARNLYARVFESASVASMQKGAGHVSGTSLWDGNVVLCGHNRGSWAYFANVKDIKLGETLTYRTSAGVRTYQVVFSGRIDATDLSVLSPSAQNQITLLTCVANVPSQRHCVIAVQNS